METFVALCGNTDRRLFSVHDSAVSKLELVINGVKKKNWV